MTTENKMTIHSLDDALRAHLDNSKQRWLDKAITDIRAHADNQEIQLTFSAMARRKLGSDILLQPQQWTTDEAARTILLHGYTQVCDDRQTAIWQAYKAGDEFEKIAIIKALHLLDSSGDLVELARHAGRTNNTALFAALALNNPYPVAHYDESAFHQLILKALFMDLNIETVFRLRSRHSQLLSQKCMELVHERLAAGRKPPVSIWLAIQIEHLSQNDEALMLEFLEHEDEAQRHYCLLALKQSSLYDKYRSLIASRDTK